MNFYKTKDDTEAIGGFSFYFEETYKYTILKCNFKAELPDLELPADDDRIFQLTLTKSDGVIGIKYDCNGKELVNVKVGDGICSEDIWASIYNSDFVVGAISFDSYHDKITEFYRRECHHMHRNHGS